MYIEQYKNMAMKMRKISEIVGFISFFFSYILLIFPTCYASWGRVVVSIKSIFHSTVEMALWSEYDGVNLIDCANFMMPDPPFDARQFLRLQTLTFPFYR